MNPSTRSRRQTILFTAVLIALMTCFTILGGELMARFILPVRDPTMNPWPKGYYEEAPRYGYRQSRNYPPTPMKTADGKSRNLVYTNSMGMRDIEPPAPASGQLRILALGCSQTEGIGVTDPSQPWPRRLEKQLDAATGKGGTDYVVMNAGVAGHNSFQEVAHARHLNPEARADVWLMAYYGGVGPGMWGRNIYGLRGQYSVKWDQMLQTEILEKFIQERSRVSLKLIEKSRLWRWICFKMTDTHLKHTVVDRPYDDLPESEKYEAATRDALRQFQQAALEASARPIVAFLPYLGDLDGLRKGVPDPVAAHVEKLCRDIGLPFLDPSPMLIARADRDFPNGKCLNDWALSDTDSHYNAEANAVYAGALAKLLALELAATPGL